MNPWRWRGSISGIRSSGGWNGGGWHQATKVRHILNWFGGGGGRKSHASWRNKWPSLEMDGWPSVTDRPVFIISKSFLILWSTILFNATWLIPHDIFWDLTNTECCLRQIIIFTPKYCLYEISRGKIDFFNLFSKMLQWSLSYFLLDELEILY